MNLNDDLAREIIRERTQRKHPTMRPSHPRTARMLRRLAERLDG